MAEKCTKTSLPPSACSMKPKPFSLLNHFTVPVAMLYCLSAKTLFSQRIAGRLPESLENLRFSRNIQSLDLIPSIKMRESASRAQELNQRVGEPDEAGS